MRISHIEIDSCLANPRRWVSDKRRGTGVFSRVGYAGATKLAIYKYHKTNNLVQAIQYLEQFLFRLGLTNRASIDEAFRNLDSYVSWCQTTVPIVAARKLRINHALGSDWILGGEISRIDIHSNATRYRGILLVVPPPDWRQQIRMPLIQRALSETLQRSENMIDVGFQNIDGSDLQIESYSKRDIDSADERAHELASNLSDEWRQQGGP